MPSALDTFSKLLFMGYKIKIQKVQRPTNKSYYVNLPAALADSMEVKKGEEFEWYIEDKNTLVLKRVKAIKNRTFKEVKDKT
jgi:antitoxin component of MazEF toxin-antitoxin module